MKANCLQFIPCKAEHPILQSEKRRALKFSLILGVQNLVKIRSVSKITKVAVWMIFVLLGKLVLLVLR